MVHHVLPAHRLGQRAPVVQVALHQAHAALGEAGGLVGRPDECGHFVAGGEEPVHQVASHEARGTGDQRLHSGRSYIR